MNYNFFLLSLFLGSAALASIEISAVSEKAAMQTFTDTPQQSPLERLMCVESGAAAAGGMDLVSYRQPGGPVLGAVEYSVQIMGETYIFADRLNLDTFKADPQRYLPAYAGFCAMSLALGSVTCPDVMNFKIEEDRLLFFEVTGFTNGKSLWETDPMGFRARADSNYKRLDTP